MLDIRDWRQRSDEHNKKIAFCSYVLMIQRPTRSTLTDTRVPYTTLVRAPAALDPQAVKPEGERDRTQGRHQLRLVHPFGIKPARKDAERGARQQIGEHTSELQSLMCISYAVFCLKKNNCTTHLTIDCLVSFYFINISTLNLSIYILY